MSGSRYHTNTKDIEKYAIEIEFLDVFHTNIKRNLYFQITNCSRKSLTTLLVQLENKLRC